MTTNDTEKLLRDCCVGIKMGIGAIDDNVDKVKDCDLRNILLESKVRHMELSRKADDMLSAYSKEPAEPGALSKGMSWFKTNIMVSVKPDDSTIAELITDGCNTGIKTINLLINNCENADHNAKIVAKNIIQLDKKLALDVSKYL